MYRRSFAHSLELLLYNVCKQDLVYKTVQGCVEWLLWWWACLIYLLRVKLSGYLLTNDGYYLAVLCGHYVTTELMLLTLQFALQFVTCTFG